MTNPTPSEASLTALAEENARLKKIVQDTLWMACRYAHGRQSYAVAMYNDAARDALAIGFLPPANEPIFAIDGSLTREMSGLSVEEFEDAWQGWYAGDAIPNHCRGVPLASNSGGEG